MTDFKPPIATRTTKELLKIVGAVEKWNNEAVEQARNELKLRNVSQDQIRHAEYLSKKADKYEDLKKAKESYNVCDFIFEPAGTMFEVLFSWELKFKESRTAKTHTTRLGTFNFDRNNLYETSGGLRKSAGNIGFELCPGDVNLVPSLLFNYFSTGRQ